MGLDHPITIMIIIIIIISGIYWMCFQKTGALYKIKNAHKYIRET